MDNFLNVSTFRRIFRLDFFSFPFLIISLASGVLFQLELYWLFITFLIYTLISSVRLFLMDFASFIKDLNKDKQNG
jgi:hypothetical protein